MCRGWKNALFVCFLLLFILLVGCFLTKESMQCQYLSLYKLVKLVITFTTVAVV